MSRKRPGGESGVALLVALVVILLVSIALALLAAGLQIRMRLVRQEELTLRLNALSDAVVAETVASLTYDQFFHGVDEQSFGGGRIASEVTFLEPGRFEVRATALYAGRERVVSAEVARSPAGARVIAWHRVIANRG